MRFPTPQSEVKCPPAEAGTVRRVLVYCLQDSGCTLLSMALAQLPSTVVVADLFIRSRIPCPQDFRTSFQRTHPNGSIVVKMTLRAFGEPDEAVKRLSAIRASFQPHLVLFFARDPWANYARLMNHGYRAEQGLISTKFRHFDALFARRHALANATLHYHEMCDVSGVAALVAQLRALGVSRDDTDLDRLLRFRRSPTTVHKEVIKYTSIFSTDARGWPPLLYTKFGLGALPGGLKANTSGLGSFREKVETDWRDFNDLSMNETWQEVRRLAPHVSTYYDVLRRKWRAGSLWGVVR